jgi:para-nitrobenzyl esterase
MTYHIPRSARGLRAVLLASLPALLVAAAAAAAPVGHDQNGKVTGLTSGTLDEFLGIRYAAPPTESLRWQPPQAVPADLATHQALAFGPHCAQLPSAYGIGSNSEDCLYLNIYRPAGVVHKNSAPLPVMVWIHGGALVVGESDDYDPAPLIATNKIIVVTINYRLGYLGYLAESGLDTEGHTAANYGLMDQQFALDYVRRNISGFGGDPNNVTIFGESAGGLSTLSNLVSPTAHGLFNQAIIESGSYSPQLPSLSQAETTGNALATTLGCGVTDETCLRNVPVASILAQQTSPTLSLTTIVDGTTLPLSINTALKTGAFNRVPIMNGSNHTEYRQFVTPYFGLTQAQYPAVLAALYGADLGAAVAAKYPVTIYAKPVYALAAVLTDQNFACNANLIDDWAQRYVPVYAYEFNDLMAPEDFIRQPGYKFGASHASELQFLFNVPKLPGTKTLTMPEQSLSAVMTQYWTNFAVNTSPSGTNVPQWLQFAKATNNMQSFVPPGAAEETNFYSTHHCGFWAPVIDPQG